MFVVALELEESKSCSEIEFEIEFEIEIEFEFEFEFAFEIEFETKVVEGGFENVVVKGLGAFVGQEPPIAIVVNELQD